MKCVADTITKLCSNEVGVQEVDGSNCGIRVDQYKAATWLSPKRGWPWCAAFVCWIVREALQDVGAKTKTKSFIRPRTAGAWDFENWSLAQDNTTWTKKPHRGDIKAGDIVIFTFSHIGIAISAPDRNGYVTTIEGNTDKAGSREGGGVFRKKRHVSKIRSRIRFRQEKLVRA
tara:strand:+ start:304 stop:822 length:519 start_codon:yes stop_codon:yes gene_type:complete